jgi:hypothetical protein
MPETETTLHKRQQLFRSMVLGTLIYSVVLGFFNDYTSILHTRSYSTTFAVALVMQLLTYATLLLKDKTVAWFRREGAGRSKAGMIFSVWLIMFLSKFVFLGAIGIIFGDAVEISGFVGLLLIIVCMTLAQALIEWIDARLGYETLEVS